MVMKKYQNPEFDIVRINGSDVLTQLSGAEQGDESGLGTDGPQTLN